MMSLRPRPAPASDDDSLLARAARLLRLELELGWAETRATVRAVVAAAAVGLAGGVALVASLVTLAAAALAPLFEAPALHLLAAGGGALLLAAAALGWSAYRLTHLEWPHQTLTSLDENWRWLVARLRSSTTSRRRAA